jgi:hypothetical protein
MVMLVVLGSLLQDYGEDLQSLRVSTSEPQKVLQFGGDPLSGDSGIGWSGRGIVRFVVITDARDGGELRY